MGSYNTDTMWTFFPLLARILMSFERTLEQDASIELVSLCRTYCNRPYAYLRDPSGMACLEMIIRDVSLHVF